LRGTNALTSVGVKVLWARPVDEDFHARYSATARRYLYLYLVRSVPSPLHSGFATRVDRLDPDAMHRAAGVLVGEHDFSSFRGAGCQARSPWRRINSIAVRAAGDLVVIDVEANAFLMHMVRNLAAALALIGRGERPQTWLGELLACRDRRSNGATAPAAGLYLAAVTYPGVSFPAPPLPGPLTALGHVAAALDRTPPFG
jgi:tRNA pseudouridine38-40 synthase